MVLFDRELEEFLKLLAALNCSSLPIVSDLRKDLGKNNMVFSDEAAYELGGGTCRSLSFELPTSDSWLIDHDAILLAGNDLGEIRTDTDFARITVLKIQDEDIKGEELYDRLEKIKFTKYRVSPEGYMLRTAVGNKEKVRVSKDAAAHAGFSQIGSAYIKAYKQLPYVEYAMIVFITGACAFHDQLKEIGMRKTRITEAVDHILKGMVLNDCNSCSVKELCDQVEGMRAIHKGLPQ